MKIVICGSMTASSEMIELKDLQFIPHPSVYTCDICNHCYEHLVRLEDRKLCHKCAKDLIGALQELIEDLQKRLNRLQDNAEEWCDRAEDAEEELYNAVVCFGYNPVNPDIRAAMMEAGIKLEPRED